MHLESALESGRKIKAAVILLNLSNIRVKQGQYARALGDLQRARAFLAEAGNVERLITCDLHTAAFYLHVGADDDAKRAIERAAGAASKESMKTRQAQSDLYRALWYRKRGQFRRAAAALERARACFLRQRKTAHVAFSNRLLAEIPTQSDATALARLAASRAIFEQQRQVIDAALCDMVRGEVLLRGKARAEAERAFKQAQSKLEHFPAYAARVSHGLARVLEQDKPLAARRYYRQAARTVAQARGETGLESVSNSFYLARQSIVTDGLAFAHKQGAPEDALALVEAAKAQLFVHWLAPHTWKAGAALPREGALREREEKLRYLLDKRRQQLTWHAESENEALRGGGVRRGTRAELTELARLEREYEAVVGELRLTHQGLGGLPSLAPFELKEFRAAAYARWGEKWAALDYYLARGRLYIVLVEPQQVRLIVRPWERLDQHLLDQATDTRRDVRELIYNGTLHRIPVPNRFDPLVLLAEKLIPRELSGREDAHLLIAPNGLLHQLPLHALPFEGQRMVERFTISYIPSLQAFAHLAQAPKFAVPQKMLVCGAAEFGGREEPLEHTRAELRALKGLVGSGEVLWQADATRAAVLERNRTGALAQFDVLHFATHAVVEQDAPHTSRVVLTDADLTVLDILELNLNAELVTLSACSSHLGTGGSGDEWIGLARAFYYAGARALVASLWEVEDATTMGLMRKMYRRVGAGDSPAMALRRAQSEAIRAGVMPYRWAAFTASGAI